MNSFLLLLALGTLCGQVPENQEASAEDSVAEGSEEETQLYSRHFKSADLDVHIKEIKRKDNISTLEIRVVKGDAQGGPFAIMNAASQIGGDMGHRYFFVLNAGSNSKERASIYYTSDPTVPPPAELMSKEAQTAFNEIGYLDIEKFRDVFDLPQPQHTAGQKQKTLGDFVNNEFPQSGDLPPGEAAAHSVVKKDFEIPEQDSAPMGKYSTLPEFLKKMKNPQLVAKLEGEEINIGLSPGEIRTIKNTKVMIFRAKEVPGISLQCIVLAAYARDLEMEAGKREGFGGPRAAFVALTGFFRGTIPDPNGGLIIVVNQGQVATID